MKHYTQSPCGHGRLVGVIPYDGESDLPHVEEYRQSVGYHRWGLIAVVLRSDRGPVPCCSYQEGEFETEADALEACEHQKRHSEKQLNEALAVLEGVSRSVWTLARVTLSDLMQLREKLAAVRDVCSVALCFEEGARVWLVDEEEDACLCEVHLVGKKILGWKGEEVTA